MSWFDDETPRLDSGLCALDCRFERERQPQPLGPRPLTVTLAQGKPPTLGTALPITWAPLSLYDYHALDPRF